MTQPAAMTSGWTFHIETVVTHPDGTTDEPKADAPVAGEQEEDGR